MAPTKQGYLGKTYGSAGMHRLLIYLLKHISFKFFYVFMYIFVIPITLILSPGARLTYQYFREKRDQGVLKSIKNTYLNHCIFGQTVIDKFAMYAGHKFKINYHGLDLLQEKMASPESFIQLSAHIGCCEILGYSIELSKPCNVLVYGGEKQDLMNYRRSSFGAKNIKMISVGFGSTESEKIIEALDNGEIVSAFADRLFNINKVVVSSLHGKKVHLARGPFSLAVNKGASVFMVSAMKENDNTYSAYFTPLYFDRSLPKCQQRQQLADAYTKEIERLLDIYPLQWFNYSNLWVEDNSE